MMSCFKEGRTWLQYQPTTLDCSVAQCRVANNRLKTATCGHGRSTNPETAFKGILQLSFQKSIKCGNQITLNSTLLYSSSDTVHERSFLCRASIFDYKFTFMLNFDNPWDQAALRSVLGIIESQSHRIEKDLRGLLVISLPVQELSHYPGQMAVQSVFFKKKLQ